MVHSMRMPSCYAFVRSMVENIWPLMLLALKVRIVRCLRSVRVRHRLVVARRVYHRWSAGQGHHGGWRCSRCWMLQRRGEGRKLGPLRKSRHTRLGHVLLHRRIRLRGIGVLGSVRSWHRWVGYRHLSVGGRHGRKHGRSGGVTLDHHPRRNRLGSGGYAMHFGRDGYWCRYHHAFVCAFPTADSAQEAKQKNATKNTENTAHIHVEIHAPMLSSMITRSNANEFRQRL